MSYYRNLPQCLRHLFFSQLFLCSSSSLHAGRWCHIRSGNCIYITPGGWRDCPRFTEGHGGGVSLCIWRKERTNREEGTIATPSVVSPARLVSWCLPSPENQMMVEIWWVTGGHRPAIPDQTLPQDHGRSWSDGQELRQVPHCHLFHEMSVTHLWVLLELLHSARLASVQTNAWSTERNQHLLAICRTIERAFLAHGPLLSTGCPAGFAALSSWINSPWQAGLFSFSLGPPVKVCLLQPENKTIILQVQACPTWRVLHHVPHKVKYCLDQTFWLDTKAGIRDMASTCVFGTHSQYVEQWTVHFILILCQCLWPIILFRYILLVRLFWRIKKLSQLMI